MKNIFPSTMFSCINLALQGDNALYKNRAGSVIKNTSNAGLGPTEISEYVGDGGKFKHQWHVCLYENQNL